MFTPRMPVIVSEARGHAFICLHPSHEVLRCRDHDGAFEREVGEVANSSAKRTFGSLSFMLGQRLVTPMEIDLMRRV